MEFTSLTRKHGIKIAPAFPCSVEQASLAVAEVVGHVCVKSAARMNSAIVIFLRDLEKVNEIVERGVTIGDTWVAVTPLTTPSKRVTLSNVPPFIADEVLERELSRFGKIASPMRKVSSGCKSPLLKHVVSHRRLVFMITKQNEELNVTFNIKHGDFHYLIYATTQAMKCFSCGKEGHQIRACPDKVDKGGQEAQDRSAKEQTAEVNTVEDKADTEEDGAGGTGDTVNSVPTTVDNHSGGVEKDTETTTEVASDEQVEEERVEEVVETVGDGMDMTEEESLLKTPKKRKTSTGSNGSQSSNKASRKAKRNELNKKAREQQGTDSSDNSQTESDGDVSEAKAAAKKGRTRQAYTVKMIKQFLQKTKHSKGVELEDHFSDRELFCESAKYHMKKGSFTDQEVYRLRKMVQTRKQETTNGDEKETT